MEYVCAQRLLPKSGWIAIEFRERQKHHFPSVLVLSVERAIEYCLTRVGEVREEAWQYSHIVVAMSLATGWCETTLGIEISNIKCTLYLFIFCMAVLMHLFP